MQLDLEVETELKELREVHERPGHPVQSGDDDLVALLEIDQEPPTGWTTSDWVSTRLGRVHVPGVDRKALASRVALDQLVLGLGTDDLTGCRGAFVAVAATHVVLASCGSIFLYSCVKWTRS